MAETHHKNATADVVSGTPGIREVRSDSGSESFGFSVEQGSDRRTPVEQGIRRVGLRAEIDTSPPFGSVQEAVTWFGGRGSWVPFYKLGEAYNGIEEFDIKKVEEQAAELEKDLIVKELETLDVLESLGSTKRIVEDLKRQLQQEALKCMATPDFHSDIKEMNEEHNYQNAPDIVAGNSSPYPASSPDMILMELKQAKLNLGKTINDLGVIQCSVESLNKKLKTEKTFVEKTCKRLTSEFAGAVSLAEELKQMRTKPQIPDDGEIFKSGVPNSPRTVMENFHVYPPREQVKTVAETMKTNNERSMTCLRTAEMRLVAARKMEEAARAAEALAIAEVKALSNNENENSPGFSLPEPSRSPLIPKTQTLEDLSTKLFSKATISKQSVLRKLEEATVEVKQSKQALEEALNRVEIANRKQLAAEDAFRRWIPGKDQRVRGEKSSKKPNNFHPTDHQTQIPFFCQLNKREPVDVVPKPALKSTVSMRDVLSRKQAPSMEDLVSGRQSDGHAVRRNVNLSQMLNELKEDVKYPTKAEKDGNDKQFLAQRRKFGFIHISLPLTKQSKKKPQALNMI